MPRGFGVIRDYRRLRRDLLAEASEGTGPVAELRTLSDLERRTYELTPEVRQVISAAPRSRVWAAVTLALGGLISGLRSRTQIRPAHTTAGAYSCWPPDRSLATTVLLWGIRRCDATRCAHRG